MLPYSEAFLRALLRYLDGEVSAADVGDLRRYATPALARVVLARRAGGAAGVRLELENMRLLRASAASGGRASVAAAISDGQRTGTLVLWLERDGSIWRVAALQ